jgi:hypothetical protein
MKRFLLIGLLVLTAYVNAQYQTREDIIWARSIAGESITLDGVLNENAWTKAESIQVVYGVLGTLPSSGYRSEFQPDANTDSTRATVKFLIDGNQLYLGFTIPDSSVGGTKDWARWDAILMSVKDKASSTRPAPASEYFYTWWLSGGGDTLTAWVGRPPRFVGKYGDIEDNGRTEAEIAAWDAVTIVNGKANDDQPDNGWTVEMRIDISAQGYDAIITEGEVVALNFSIWDVDNVFGGDASKISAARTWWQAPWGNAHGPNFGRVMTRPDVTINSGALPVVPPDVIIPNGAGLPDPVIDGKLDEATWAGAYSFNIAWSDSILRASYPGVGPLASGQWQPELVTGSRPPILDPSFATIKMLFKDHYLYLGADVNDQLIQGTETYDQVDGLGLILADRGTLDENEHIPVFKLLRMNFSLDGTLQAYDALTALIDSGANIAAILKGQSTININTDVDEGYYLEMKLDLTKFGYPTDLGDKLLFAGLDLYDGDSFDDAVKNYGTRTWWFREHTGGPAAAWMELDPNKLTDVEKTETALIPETISLNGNYPNPFNPSTKINYSIPQSGNVNLMVYNGLGQQISRIPMGNQIAGTYEYKFNANDLASGIYFYQILLQNVDGKSFESIIGKMILMK